MAPRRSRAHAESSGSAAEPAAKRFKTSYNETITVLVGPEEEKFTVHKSLACDNSLFFKAACSRRWTEGRDKSIRLPDTTPESFEIFLHWVYTNKLIITDGPDKFARTHDLGTVWALGNYLQSQALRNAVIDHLLAKFERSEQSQIPRAALTYIWSITPPDATIRRLLIDWHLAYTTPEWFERYVDEWPQDLVVAAAKQFFAARTSGVEVNVPSLKDRCKYHEHEREDLRETVRGSARRSRVVKTET